MHAVKTEFEIDKLKAEIQVLRAQHGKITREVFWYPVIVATGFIGAVAGATIGILKLFGLF